MIISSPFVIILSAEEHQELTGRAHRARTAHRDVIRAQIILSAADGQSNAAIAAEVDVHLDTVRKWRRRFCTEGLAGLNDRPRSGRPRRFTAIQVAEVKALACELPATRQVPLARWSCPDLAAEARRRGVVASGCHYKWPLAFGSSGLQMVSAAARIGVASTIMPNTAVHTATTGGYNSTPKPRPRQQRDRRSLHRPAADDPSRDVARKCSVDVMETRGGTAHICALRRGARRNFSPALGTGSTMSSPMCSSGFRYACLFRP